MAISHRYVSFPEGRDEYQPSTSMSARLLGELLHILLGKLYRPHFSPETWRGIIRGIISIGLVKYRNLHSLLGNL